MPLKDHTIELHTVPCLDDNYAFILFNTANRQAALVDVPDAAPILAKLDDLGAILTDVILTHHHWDHVDGLPNLASQRPFRVIGGAADAHRLPPLDLAVSEGDTFNLLGHATDVYNVSGHTIGHIALNIPALEVAFTADSLMAMGCGRLFEGTPAQMWDSMLKLRALPPSTTICSGHEYMGGNMAFAQSLGEDNPDLVARAAQVADLRGKGIPTVPSSLEVEMKTNPFLRADDPSLQAAIGMAGQSAAAVFTEIRKRKDNF